ncbi:MAG: hypothetical protein KDE25_09700, partial [Novosphingobium sp.]|nr:hypothetical protein [Novosphingobium sp.]
EAGNSGDLETYCMLFAFPIAVGGNGQAPATVSDPAKWRASVQASIDDLTARGWATSVIDALHVGLMAGDTGVITVAFSRLAADGVVMESCTGNYLARKLDETWKIVGIIAP